MTDAAALEHEAHLAREAHCERIRLWVAQGHVGAVAGASACEDRGRVGWMHAYLRLQWRATMSDHPEGFNELRQPPLALKACVQVLTACEKRADRWRTGDRISPPLEQKGLRLSIC